MSKFIIGEDNWQQVASPDSGFGTGWDEDQQPFELGGNVRKFTGRTKTRAEIIEGIKYRKANKARTRDVCDQAGVPILHQGTTPLCWMFGNVRQVLIAMARTGQPLVRQSPASLAYKITGGVYRGGYNGEAIEGLANIGTVPTEFWPDTSFEKKYNTKQNDARRTKWALEWMELERGNLDQLYTVIDDGFTVGMALPWWRHIVCGEDLDLAANGDILTDFGNSHGINFGDRGHGSLTPKKSQGHYIALRAITAQ